MIARGSLSLQTQGPHEVEGCLLGRVDLVTGKDLYSGTTFLPSFLSARIFASSFFAWISVELAYHMV